MDQKYFCCFFFSFRVWDRLFSLRFSQWELLLPEELVLQPWQCDREVNDGHLDADLGQVVGVGHLGGHVEPEVTVVVNVAVSQTNQQTATLSLEKMHRWIRSHWLISPRKTWLNIEDPKLDLLISLFEIHKTCEGESLNWHSTLWVSYKNYQDLKNWKKNQDKIHGGWVWGLTDMKVCFSRTGSRAGSRNSPMSSHRTGIPIRIQFSSVRRNCPSVSLMIFRPFLASLFLIQRLACQWRQYLVPLGHKDIG